MRKLTMTKAMNIVIDGGLITFNSFCQSVKNTNIGLFQLCLRLHPEWLKQWYDPWGTEIEIKGLTSITILGLAIFYNRQDLVQWLFETYDAYEDLCADVELLPNEAFELDFGIPEELNDDEMIKCRLDPVQLQELLRN